MALDRTQSLFQKHKPNIKISEYVLCVIVAAALVVVMMILCTINLDKSDSFNRDEPIEILQAFNLTKHLIELQEEFVEDVFTKCQAVLFADKDENKLKTVQNEAEYEKNHKTGWSQVGQDQFIYSNFFQNQTNGIYVDIGANTPLHHSNTAFFDGCMNWKGICVEPTDLADTFQHSGRSCSVAKKCAFGQSGANLKMNLQGETTAIINNANAKSAKRNIFSCDTISSTDLFQDFNATNKNGESEDLTIKKQIDYISLDIEGAEMDFLKTFPFNEYKVKVWTIELNKGNSEMEIDAWMYKHGYIKSAYVYTPWSGERLDGVYVPRNQ